MCWTKVNNKLAYMLGHCWNKPQFETMKKSFPRTEITVRYADHSDARIPLDDMDYDSPCVKVRRNKMVDVAAKE